MSLAQLSIDKGIATLTLNRAESRNAMSIDLLASLHHRMSELEAAVNRGGAGGPRVCIITGEGRAFCAGMDLKQVLGDAEGGAPLKLLSSLGDLCLRIRALPIPTIAAVNGAAIGGGCGLSTVADFSITHADSKMGFPEVDLGVCPAVVAPWLVRKIGAGRARAVLLRGGVMSGAEAHAIGIVNECVATLEELLPAAGAIAARLCAGGPVALAATKGLLNELDGSLDRGVAQRAAELSARVLATPEAQATLRARLGT
ncbi:MAG: enoyl-CoA hydratase/isomerase family protein [Phycisphaeraceae bacterium]|nr:enoyl-CoA hydratase/isomerase family protein [Phycisphaeraceae bacterium]